MLIPDCAPPRQELAQLIMKKDIKARIDSHNKIVYASHADQEAATYNSALQVLPKPQPPTLKLGARSPPLQHQPPKFKPPNARPQ